MSHKHITPSQKNEIAALLRVGTSQKEIAEIVNKTPSAISQEINKNKDADGVYRARSAKRKSKLRRINANKRFLKLENNEELRNYVVSKLKEHWSPEQIAGRLERGNQKHIIGKDCIYAWIYRKRKDLVKFLRCKKGKYRRRYGTRIREKQREEAKVRRIDTRPKVVEEKVRVGDWEGDTIIGKERTRRILTNVDRKSGYALVDYLPVTNMEKVHLILQRRFKRISRSKKHTYTYDNGAELGKEDRDLEKRIGMDIFRAFPYHSWERGCNENFNGLLREFFPKGMKFSKIKLKDIKEVEKLLNNRPRKRLNYATPKEVFFGKDSTDVILLN